MLNTTSVALKKNDGGLWKNIKLNAVSYAMMSPFMILFIIFTVIPVVAAIVLSFTYFDMLQAPKFIGLQNYERMFINDNVFLIVLKNTLLFAVFTGPLSYILSFLFAWLINEFGPKLRSVLTLVFYAPSLCGNVYFIWAIIFSGDAGGYLNSILMNLGITHAAIQWFSDTNYMIGVLIFVQLWMSLGVSFLNFIAGFQSLDKSLFEAGAIDGIKNRWQELFYITVPQMAPQLMFSAVMQISATFAVSDIIMNLAGFPTTQYGGDTIVTYMLDVGTIRYEMGYACALAVFLFALMIIINQIIMGVLRKYRQD